MIKNVTSRVNPWFKSIKKLQTKKARTKEQKFILEGFKMTQEALASNKGMEVIVLEGLVDKYLSLFKQHQVPVYCLPESLFNEISETQTPQGILSVVIKEDYSFDDIINKKNGFFVLLDHVSDPGNMGTLIRSADAFNVDAIFLTKGCVDPFSGKAIRSTMGSILRVPIIELTMEQEKFLCEQQTIKMYAAMLEGQSVNRWESCKENVLLILGNEANGVEHKWERYASPITIPMSGKTESLNVAVAGSILIQRMTEKHS